MIINPTTYNEQARHGWTHEAVVDYTDLTDTAGVRKVVALWNVNPGDVVEKVGFKLISDFDGGSTSSLDITVGDGDDTDRFIGSDAGGTSTSATIIHADDTEVDWACNDGQGISAPHTYSAADTIDAVFFATGANLSTLTAGKIRIVARICSLDS